MGAGTRAGRRKRSDSVSMRKAGPRRESSELGVREHRSADVEPEGLHEWVGRVWGWQQSPEGAQLGRLRGIKVEMSPGSWI